MFQFLIVCTLILSYEQKRMLTKTNLCLWLFPSFRFESQAERNTGSIIGQLNMGKLIYEAQTYQLNGVIFKVREQLKTGWGEETYHQATVEACKECDIPVEWKVRKSLSHWGVEVHRFECDIVAWDLIVLDMKNIF
jgi:hypothetical protein